MSDRRGRGRITKRFPAEFRVLGVGLLPASSSLNRRGRWSAPCGLVWPTRTAWTLLSQVRVLWLPVNKPSNTLRVPVDPASRAVWAHYRERVAPRRPSSTHGRQVFTFL